MVFLANTHNPSVIIRKSTTHPNTDKISNLKSVKVITNKENLRKCDNYKQSKETCHLNIIWYIACDPGKGEKKNIRQTVRKSE